MSKRTVVIVVAVAVLAALWFGGQSAVQTFIEMHHGGSGMHTP